jgi:hypothetical protein
MSSSEDSEVAGNDLKGPFHKLVWPSFTLP